jgi:signal transduction histidine kinase
VGTLSEHVADSLNGQAATLAAHWQERAQAAAPRTPLPDMRSVDADAAQLLRALAGCLYNDARSQGEVMRLGWAAGTTGHAAGWSMHHLLRDGELLVAVVLTAAEQAVSSYTGEGAGAAEGLALARRIHRVGAVYQQAGATGFMHAYLEALRLRYRTLRHDLRNPLGTIRSALSLMEDEMVPLEARSGPRVRAMLGRNAGSLDALIGSELGDASIRPLVFARQALPLREVALAARRALREAMRLAECDVVVGESLPVAHVNGATLELALSAVVLAAFRHAAPGTVVRIGDAPGDARTVVLCVSREPAPAAPSSAADEGTDAGALPCWDADGMALAESLTSEAGGRLLVAGPMVRIELPAPVGAEAPAVEALAVEAPAVEAPASATAAGSALHLANELGRAN